MDRNEHSYFCDSFLEESVDEDEILLEEEEDKDVLLISIVRGYPHLYDRKKKDFRDVQMKENSWKEIGLVMDMKREYLKLVSLKLVYYVTSHVNS